MHDIAISLFLHVCIQDSRGLPTLSVISSVPTIAMIGFKVGPDLTRHTSTEFWLSMTLTTVLSMSMVTDAVIEMQCTRTHICFWSSMLLYAHNYAQDTHENMHFKGQIGGLQALCCSTDLILLCCCYYYGFHSPPLIVV